MTKVAMGQLTVTGTRTGGRTPEGLGWEYPAWTTGETDPAWGPTHWRKTDPAWEATFWRARTTFFRERARVEEGP